MAYRGRYFLGQRLPLTLLCVDGNHKPTLPDRSPTVRLYGANGFVTAYRIPIKDKYGLTGYFQATQQLDSRFAVGKLRVVYQYAIGGTAYCEEDAAQIVPGGDADGTSVSMAVMATPPGTQVLVQTDSGRVVRRRNPRLA